MPSVVFKGFSKYHGRNLCSVTFSNVFEKQKFEINFNMNYRNAVVQAEPDCDNNLTVNIVYTNDVSDEEIRIAINNLL